MSGTLSPHLERFVPALRRYMKAAITTGAYVPEMERIWRAFEDEGFGEEYARIHDEVKAQNRPFGADGLGGIGT